MIFQSYGKQLEEFGYVVTRENLHIKHVDMLKAEIARATPHALYPKSIRCRKRRIYAIRNLLQISPEVANILRQTFVVELLQNILGKMFIIQSMLFNKIKEANFRVAFHQDVVMPCYKTQTSAQMICGVPHHKLPLEVLQHLVIVRIHLDENNRNNGPLLVLPKTHTSGVLSDRQIEHFVNTCSADECLVNIGGILLMKPLILHSSHRSLCLNERRVIHLVLAPKFLDTKWFFRDSILS